MLAKVLWPIYLSRFFVTHICVYRLSGLPRNWCSAVMGINHGHQSVK